MQQTAATTGAQLQCMPLCYVTAPNQLSYAHTCVRAVCACLQTVHPCSALGTEEQLVVPGYGVEAVLKNMEYSALDDKAKADAEAKAKADAEAAAKAGAAKSKGGSEELSGIDLASLGEVKGFKFDVLVQRKPHLVQELMTFRDVLMSTDEDEAIKVRSRSNAECCPDDIGADCDAAHAASDATLLLSASHQQLPSGSLVSLWRSLHTLICRERCFVPLPVDWCWLCGRCGSSRMQGCRRPAGWQQPRTP